MIYIPSFDGFIGSQLSNFEWEIVIKANQSFSLPLPPFNQSLFTPRLIDTTATVSLNQTALYGFIGYENLTVHLNLESKLATTSYMIRLIPDKEENVREAIRKKETQEKL